MVAALDDDDHEREQRERYERRRASSMPAMKASGLTVDHSEAGLYIWGLPAASPAATPSAGLRNAALSSRPASSTAPLGAQHVRVALTATDERIAAAVERLTA